MLRYGQKQKRATCFERLKNDDSRFTTQVQTGLATLSPLQVAWILTSYWIKLWKSHIIHRSYVTCRNFVEKIRTTVNYSLLSVTRQQSFVACKHSDFFFFARQIWTWVVKRATSLFKSIASNDTKQVARFCCLYSISTIFAKSVHSLCTRYRPFTVIFPRKSCAARTLGTRTQSFAVEAMIRGKKYYILRFCGQENAINRLLFRSPLFSIFR